MLPKTESAPAVRARTVLAVAPSAGWTLGHGLDRLVAPHLDVNGTPVLLVDREGAERLLDPGRVTTVVHAGRLGTLMISGWPRELGDGEFAAERAAYRMNHAACGPGCHGPVAIAVEVSHVRITGANDQEFAPVPLADFRRAAPDPFVVAGAPVLDHLNEAHGAELIMIAAALTDVAESDVLGARITTVAREDLVLTVIDGDGAEDHLLVFDRPLTTIDDLGAHLHRLLTDPTAYLRE